MSQYRRILLIADSSLQRTPAFRRAQRLATATGAELHIGLFEYRAAIGAVGRFSAEVMELARRAYLREREEWLEDAALAMREDGVKVHTEAIWGKPQHEHILAKVLDLKPDLVIKDVHLEPLLKRVLFTPLDWQLLRLCPAPLLLVNRAADLMPRRIVAAVDPVQSGHGAETLDERVLHEALALAIQCDAQVQLVHVFEGPPTLLDAEAVATAASLAEIYERLREVHSARFAEFARAHGVPQDRQHLLYGDAAGSIAAFAGDAEADIVVMGTVQRSGLERLVMGSTAERVLSELSCDALLVKPEGFDEQLARHLGLGKPNVLSLRRGAQAG